MLPAIHLHSLFPARNAGLAEGNINPWVEAKPNCRVSCLDIFRYVMICLDIIWLDAFISWKSRHWSRVVCLFLCIQRDWTKVLDCRFYWIALDTDSTNTGRLLYSARCKVALVGLDLLETMMKVATSKENQRISSRRWISRCKVFFSFHHHQQRI